MRRSIFPNIAIAEARLAARRRVRFRSRTRFPFANPSFEFSHNATRQVQNRATQHSPRTGDANATPKAQQLRISPSSNRRR
jgi:hypothetical protein